MFHTPCGNEDYGTEKVITVDVMEKVILLNKDKITQNCEMKKVVKSTLNSSS